MRFPSCSESGYLTPEVFYVSFSSAQSSQPPLCVASWGTRRNDQNQMEGKGRKFEEMDMVIPNKVVDSKKYDVNQGVKLPFCIPPWNQ